MIREERERKKKQKKKNKKPKKKKEKKREEKMEYHIHPCASRRISLLPLALCLVLSITITTTVSAFNRTTIRFDEGYTPLFSDFNIDRSPDDKTVRLLLNRLSGHPNKNYF